MTSGEEVLGPLFGGVNTSFVVTLNKVVFSLPKENVAIVTFGRTSGKPGTASYQRTIRFSARAMGRPKVGLEPDAIGMKGLRRKVPRGG